MAPKYRHRQNEIEAMIVAGHRAGVCDKDGNSVPGAGGLPVVKPRSGYVTFRKVYPRYPKTGE